MSSYQITWYVSPETLAEQTSCSRLILTYWLHSLKELLLIKLLYCFFFKQQLVIQMIFGMTHLLHLVEMRCKGHFDRVGVFRPNIFYGFNQEIYNLFTTKMNISDVFGVFMM